MKQKETILPSEVIESLEERMQESSSSPSSQPQTASGPEPFNPINDSYSGSLDDAASLLLRQLVPSVRDYAFELADITLKIPRWQLVLGSVLSQYSSGNLQAPEIDPSWRQIEVVSGSSICGKGTLDGCKRPFTPQRYGEMFCSPDCGNKARKRQIDEINQKKADELKLRRRIEAIEKGETVTA
jgi:hypothetical protein